MRRIQLFVLVMLLGWSAAARAGDFIDTRLNFTITDENMLVKPGETNPSIPGLRIDRPNSFGILFFDNYDTRYTGYESLTHLVLYKKMVGKNWEGEGALVLRFLEFSDISLSSIDDGSYLKITYFFDKTRQKKDNISITAFPLSADRMRLGFSYRLSWGGSPIFFKFNPDLPTTAQVPVNTAPAPGARIQFANDRLVAWVGFKTSTLLNRNPQVNEQIAVYGALGGLTVDPILNRFRIELNGGYFYRGTNPLFYSTQDTSVDPVYRDYSVYTAGGSIQMSVFDGITPSGSLDYKLYNSDATTAARYFAKFNYRPGFNWIAQAEFTMLTTLLQNPDQPDSQIQQLGYAGDVILRGQYGHSRGKILFSARSLSFMLLNQPSLVPYQDFPTGVTITPDMFISAGYDYNFTSIGLTTGLTAGVDFPASYTPPAVTPGQGYCPKTGSSACTISTIVVRGEGDYSILPEKDSNGNRVEAMPIWSAKLVLREDFLDFFAAILDVYFTYDPNQTHLTKSASGDEIRDFNHPYLLGFNLTLQARF